MIQSFPSPDAWAEAAADRLAEALRVAIAERGQAVFAGAGGSTPSPIYRRLAGADLDWSRVVVLPVDERHVPESSPDSNARLLRETLMTGPAAAATLLPLHHAAVTVDRSAALAARALQQVGGRVDAALLGMGEDGHILSIFPGSPTLKSLLSPKLKPTVLGVPKGRDGLAPSLERISLNIPYLKGAGRVVLALTGAKKREVFERELTGDPAVTPIAALVASVPALDVIWTEAG
ncbi:6-phosphogluconolactonase [Brevundimonas balnearis]|uniref:6-phosphogluconolactonase n=1 Tax=Brevundimonas balnearis TaxID=1572858 RepID=A0ABV6R7B3_9CAUL